MSAFSDCFVISDTGPLAYTVVARAQELAFTLLETQGIVCRGGIVEGPFHHANGIAFGPALIHAYALERRAAHYPRLVVHPTLAAKYVVSERQLREVVREPPNGTGAVRNVPIPSLLKRDADGCYFVDLFVPIHEIDPARHRWDLDGQHWRERFERVRQHLEQRFEASRADRNVERGASTHWIVRQFNEGIQREDFVRRVGRLEPIPYDSVTASAG